MKKKARELTKVELFYVDENRNTLSDLQMSKDLGVPVASIREVVAVFDKRDKDAGTKPKAPKLGQFAVHGNKEGLVVSMTPAQSAKDDETKVDRKQQFLDAHKDHIHQIV